MTAVRTPSRTAVRRAPTTVPSQRRTADRPNLRVAAAPTATRQVRAFWVVGVVAVLVAVLVVMASQALLVQGQDRLDELQRSLTEQQSIAERQQLQLAELQSPERVVAAATDRLGMVPPTDVVHLRSDPADDASIAVAPQYPVVDADVAGQRAAEVDPGDSSDAPAGADVPAAATDELAAGDTPAASDG